MFRHSVHMTGKISLPSPDNTSPSDSESEIFLELEAKRKQLDEEIMRFRSQKEKEFRDFENELRASRRLKGYRAPSQKNGQHSDGTSTRPKRTASSSALDLLVGHGTPKYFHANDVSTRRNGKRLHAEKDLIASKTLPSKPTLSLDPLNIKGETVPQTHPHTPPTPTLPSRSLMQVNVESKSPESEARPGRSTSPPSTVLPPTPMNERYDSFAGLFVPSYLPLLDARPNPQFPSPSPLVTPPIEPNSGIDIQKLSPTLPDGIIPLQSSSFPPHIIISSNSHGKRAYTAPALPRTRMPSALRTSSAGSLNRKGKRVTFRLADSAIVEPSSSYEEGPSPQVNDVSKSAPAAPGTASPLRNTRHNMLGSRKTSDEEDEEAGVKPGMNMGEVIQKLNNYTLPSADDDEPNVEYAEEDEEDVGYIDTKYHEEEEEDDIEDDGIDDEDDDDNLQMSLTPAKPTDHDTSEADEEGYFSPRANHIPANQRDTEQLGQQHKPGSSPLSPFRDDNWDKLSSSDKDRLLFKGRTSDEDLEIHSRKTQAGTLQASRSSTQRSKERKGSREKSTQATASIPDKVNFEHAIDGGSGVGFFELDEELASPDAGVARPFEFAEPSESLDDLGDKPPSSTQVNRTGNILDSAATAFGEVPQQSQDATRFRLSEKTMRDDSTWPSDIGKLDATVGSVPIAIIRPSTSVSSSWVGTFGH